jgi:magnesium chelatase subunit H
MPKPTSAADRTTVKVVIVTLDNHLAGATLRAQERLARSHPGITVRQHAATEWAEQPKALEACLDDIATGDIVIATMLFMEPHVRLVRDALAARRDHCDALVCCMSAPEITKLTRIGGFTMDGKQNGPLAFLKKFKPKQEAGQSASAGAQQMQLLRRLPQLLKFLPGKAQDVRAYFLTLSYWISGSEENVENMVRFLVDRYADGPRRALRGKVPSEGPVNYPEVGLYHPDLKHRVTEKLSELPGMRKKGAPRVGVLIMRSYVLAGNAEHYDGVIRSLEAKGLVPVPAFASGLDARPAIEAFFRDGERTRIDALVSLTGFSLVGGPAYNDARAAEEVLAALDVPYLAAHPVEFQTVEQWEHSERGLSPVESTIMVSIPELDGASGPMVFGGRRQDADDGRNMRSVPDRAEMLVARIARLVRLRRTPVQDRRVALVLFNFPPGGGATGTAANLAVWESLHETLAGMAAAGYDVEVPEDVDALRDAVLGGNSERFGTDANVAMRIPVDDHVRKERWLTEIEAAWGPAPGKNLTDGASLFVLGRFFGKVFVTVQPGFGYEGDPMRLLFEKSFAPTHAFSAFYRFLREEWDAHAALHFGTHGALEFMPGKQVGLSGDCWPDRLIGDLPNLYLYASNNPSEGAIAKRRSAATLVSYLTPSIARAGVYRELADLKGSLDRWRGLEPEREHEREDLAALIQLEAAALELCEETPTWSEGERDAEIARLCDALREIEETLIPDGLHVVGRPLSENARAELLGSMADARGASLSAEAMAALARGEGVRGALEHCATRDDATQGHLEELARVEGLLRQDHEVPALLHALDGGFVRPAPGGDLLRNPEVLPAGRNVHGFDPFRLPSSFALRDGARQADLLLDRHRQDGHGLPECVALVLWGTDNLKSEGGPIAQALALIGARPRFDSYGRLCGADLIPLEELGRPRVDVVITLSGIFRDLLPLQTRLLAEAASLAAHADEPLAQNFVRAHALAHAEQHGCDLETAALRVFSNADGAYGSNVNLLLDSGAWGEESELSDTYRNRKSFAYGVSGEPVQQAELLDSVLGHVELAYQNLESVELGVTTIDHYFDTLGGISLAAKQSHGNEIPVYIGDQTRGDDKVRTLNEQLALESRTRMLNPKWYEGLLNHGYEGVRQIEAHVTNTLGWSATTGQVDEWVYGKLSETFVLDEVMRERLAQLNPTASLRLADRLLEATEREYWKPDASILEALRDAKEALEDRLEGLAPEGAAAA